MFLFFIQCLFFIILFRHFLIGNASLKMSYKKLCTVAQTTVLQQLSDSFYKFSPVSLNNNPHSLSSHLIILVVVVALIVAVHLVVRHFVLFRVTLHVKEVSVSYISSVVFTSSSSSSQLVGPPRIIVALIVVALVALFCSFFHFIIIHRTNPILSSHIPFFFALFPYFYLDSRRRICRSHTLAVTHSTSHSSLASSHYSLTPLLNGIGLQRRPEL